MSLWRQIIYVLSLGTENEICLLHFISLHPSLMIIFYLCFRVERPKAGEDEEHLLKMQHDFMALSASQSPACHAVEKRKSLPKFNDGYHDGDKITGNWCHLYTIFLLFYWRTVLVVVVVVLIIVVLVKVVLISSNCSNCLSSICNSSISCSSLSCSSISYSNINNGNTEFENRFCSI